MAICGTLPEMTDPDCVIELATMTLMVEGRVLGIVHVGTLEPREFTADDIALLELAADRIAIAIDRARQHSVARTLQERLLPARLPTVLGLELAARYQPGVDDTHVSKYARAAKTREGFQRYLEEWVLTPRKSSSPA